MASRPLLSLGVAVLAISAGGLAAWWQRPPRDEAGALAPESPVARLTRMQQRASPEDSMAQGRLATLWMTEALRSGSEEQVTHARLAARRALLVDPERVDALKVELLLLHHDHQFRELRDAARSLTTQHPHDAFFQGMLGDAELELGRFDEAEAAYTRMMDLKPSHATYTRVGYLQLMRGEVNAALDSLKLAASSVDRMDGNSVARALCEIGDVYLARADPDTAMEYFDVALTHAPGLGRAHAGRGHVLRARGQDTAAIEAYRAALAASPHGGHRASLADALEAAGRTPEAQAEYQRALADSAEDAREQARLMLDLGLDIGRAETLARAELTRRQDVLTQAVLAQALVSAGKVDEARPLVAAFLRAGTRHARLDLVAGLVASASGEPVAARQHLEAALRGFPPLPPRQQARARALLTPLAAPVQASARPPSTAGP
ncbi:tetratricopeptide repeat protein [Myxococcus sp. K38C18041901]|uniref:tetratricopeptide repeat protein n=1 Tax=Myxococcus guangdongensis TaxID=2906760 RepID=UPI0020A70883|nr:tetratricopeptide repeat protein [Myxococcus guangdongensis]MCP3061783.1 tetratricopeptide repeat protein [Myxococcus guangdongensis]